MRRLAVAQLEAEPPVIGLHPPEARQDSDEAGEVHTGRLSKRLGGDHRCRPNVQRHVCKPTSPRLNFVLIPIFDLASRYRFEPLLSHTQDSERIALFLEKRFQQHGAPLFLKRDNGSPFNAAAVDQVMARHWVLPLNNPPRYPRYNGAMEKSIRDLKSRLTQRLAQSEAVPLELLAQVEATVHQLNHEPRRCLQGRTACDAYHQPGHFLRLNRRARAAIFRLLHLEFLQTIGTTELVQ